MVEKSGHLTLLKDHMKDLDLMTKHELTLELLRLDRMIRASQKMGASEDQIEALKIDLRDLNLEILVRARRGQQ